MSPNLVEPLENDSVKCVTDDEMIICCAVMSPATIKFPKKVPLPVTAKLSLMFKEPLIVAPVLTVNPFVYMWLDEIYPGSSTNM